MGQTPPYNGLLLPFLTTLHQNLLHLLTKNTNNNKDVWGRWYAFEKCSIVKEPPYICKGLVLQLYMFVRFFSSVVYIFQTILLELYVFVRIFLQLYIFVLQLAGDRVTEVTMLRSWIYFTILNLTECTHDSGNVGTKLILKMFWIVDWPTCLSSLTPTLSFQHQRAQNCGWGIF